MQTRNGSSLIAPYDNLQGATERLLFLIRSMENENQVIYLTSDLGVLHNKTILQQKLCPFEQRLPLVGTCKDFREI